MRIEYEDSSHPTYALVAIVQGGAFGRIPDKNKWKIYDTLRCSSKMLADGEKRKLYEELSEALAEPDATKLDATVSAIHDQYCQNKATKR